MWEWDILDGTLLSRPRIGCPRLRQSRGTCTGSRVERPHPLRSWRIRWAGCGDGRTRPSGESGGWSLGPAPWEGVNRRRPFVRSPHDTVQPLVARIPPRATLPYLFSETPSNDRQVSLSGRIRYSDILVRWSLCPLGRSGAPFWHAPERLYLLV